MSTRLIVFATYEEASASLDALNATPIAKHVFSSKIGEIVISGMGIKSAWRSVTQHAPLVDEVWNLGLAGALKADLEIGSLCTICAVGKQGNRIALGEGSHTLFTSTIPVHDKAVRTRLGKTWDLVDMEGYGVVKAAHHLNKKCVLRKAVSDFASPGGSALIKQNMSYLSQVLLDSLLAIISYI